MVGKKHQAAKSRGVHAIEPDSSVPVECRTQLGDPCEETHYHEKQEA